MTTSIKELEQERIEGKEEGMVKTHLNSLLRKIQKGKFYEQIMDELEIDDETYFESLWDLVQDILIVL